MRHITSILDDLLIFPIEREEQCSHHMPVFRMGNDDARQEFDSRGACSSIGLARRQLELLLVFALQDLEQIATIW